MPSSPVARLLSLRTPVAIAHRGGSKLRPENTLDAFRHAARLGVDALECDVHLSRDRQVVVIHDDTLDRTTDAGGPVAARTADELARVDAGYRFEVDGRHPFRGQGIGVPRLADVLACWPGPVVVEVKGDRPDDVAVVLEQIRASAALDRVVIGGFSQAVLRAVRHQAPDLPTSASRLEVQSAIRRAWFRLGPRPTGFAVFQVPVRLKGRTILTRAFARAARRADYPVQAWVVDDPAEMRTLLEWGVTGLISDRPDLAVAVLRESGGRLNGESPVT
jgi:glycerophosphoryl diester phosphodiesterase